MNEELMKEKISFAFKKKIKAHIILKDKTWRNGFVKDISADFFIFEDDINGKEAIFFLELVNVEPFMEDEK